MTASAQQITDAALKLPDRERLRVATAIWKSLGASEEHVDDLAALARSHEVESGQVTPKTQTEVFRNARAVL
ncbi:MAG: hypothetical protein ABI273_07415 [Lacunisphaera sp.]